LKKPGVLVVNADRQEGQAVVGLLSGLTYQATPLHGLDDLESHLQTNPTRVVLLDLDTMRTDNQFFRIFKKRHPGIFILGASSRSYHPGLEEALGSHIYACLTKPLDPEELLYWLKSIPEDSSNSQEERLKAT
jgi:DNA-binding NtrC family response regulator